MTFRFKASAFVVAVLCLFASCMSDSDYSTTTYDDAAITSLTLGTITVQKHTTSSTGEDSTYTTTYTGSNTPMYIDNIGKKGVGLIYNPDSLPAGSQVDKILLTISTKNSGTLYLRGLDEKDTTYYYYSSTDSIAFVDSQGNSVKRKFRVGSTSGKNYRDYKVEVRVHKEEKDSFTWDPLNDLSPRMTSIKGVVAYETPVVIGTVDGNRVLKWYNAKEDKWEGLPGTPELALNATIATDNQYLYVYTDNTLWRHNGKKWTLVQSDMTHKAILGGCFSKTNPELYAYDAQGSLCVSTDSGSTWNEDRIASYEDVSRLPASDYTLTQVYVNTNDLVERVAFVGNFAEENTTDTVACVWNKLVDKADPQGWYEVTHNKYVGKRVLPRLKNLSVVRYYKYLLAIGGEPIYDNTGLKPYSKVYGSEDQGLTWGEVIGLKMPDEIDKTKPLVILASDETGYLYFVQEQTGKVWRCKVNNATWTQNPYVIK